MAYLAIFASGQQEPQRVELDESTILGRSRECGVCIRDPNISRTHCKIVQDDGKWMLYDLQSTNGTWLDAARVYRYTLRDGETFYIGDARLVFHAATRVENRPEDPNEASRVAEMIGESGGLSDTLLQDRPARQPMVARPALRVKPTSEKAATVPAPKPLPFRRPRATPIVRPAESRGWVGAILGLRRQ